MSVKPSLRALSSVKVTIWVTAEAETVPGALQARDLRGGDVSHLDRGRPVTTGLLPGTGRRNRWCGRLICEGGLRRDAYELHASSLVSGDATIAA